MLQVLVLINGYVVKNLTARNVTEEYGGTYKEGEQMYHVVNKINDRSFIIQQPYFEDGSHLLASNILMNCSMNKEKMKNGWYGKRRKERKLHYFKDGVRLCDGWADSNLMHEKYYKENGIEKQKCKKCSRFHDYILRIKDDD